VFGLRTSTVAPVSINFKNPNNAAVFQYIYKQVLYENTLETTKSKLLKKLKERSKSRRPTKIGKLEARPEKALVMVIHQLSNPDKNGKEYEPYKHETETELYIKFQPKKNNLTLRYKP
jgi:hypothetical protein